MNTHLTPVEKRQLLGIGAVALGFVILWLLMRRGDTNVTNQQLGNNVFDSNTPGFTFGDLPLISLPGLPTDDRLQMIGACCADCSSPRPVPVFTQPDNGSRFTFVFNAAAQGPRIYNAINPQPDYTFSNFHGTGWA